MLQLLKNLLETYSALFLVATPRSNGILESVKINTYCTTSTKKIARVNESPLSLISDLNEYILMNLIAINFFIFLAKNQRLRGKLCLPVWQTIFYCIDWRYANLV